MKPLLAIGLSPNAENEDIQAAKKILRDKASWRNQEHVAEATETFRKQLGVSCLLLTSSGRSALYQLLKAYGIGKGDEVIVQAFTCIAVPEPILWVNATPVYADIDRETFSMSAEDFKKKISPQTKAVIVQHTFGVPGAITEIMRIAREHNILVIEDCAHALGSTVEGQQVGTLADAAIFSFGRDKTLSTVFGGAVYVKDEAVFQALKRQRKLLSMPPTEWVEEQLRHPIAFDMVKRWYHLLGLGKLYMSYLRKSSSVSKAVEAKERQGEMPDHIQYAYSPALAQLLMVQLQKVSNILARRKEIAKQYDEAFKQTYPGAVLMRYPLLLSNRSEILQKAKEENIILGDWYDAPLVPADADLSVFQYEKESCPVAERLAQQVINLPTYHALTDEDVERVIAIVTKYAKRV